MLTKSEQYMKAADIADMLLSRGFPVRSFESYDDQIVMRFSGPRAQEIHVPAATASFEVLSAAYERAPP